MYIYSLKLVGGLVLECPNDKETNVLTKIGPKIESFHGIIRWPFLTK